MLMNKAVLLNIRSLLDLVESKKIDLPNIQRGFIWKPSQIENLWDSLLRGFPAGAIITGRINPKKFQLLDGQQRTTSIALGFANLESKSDTAGILRSSTNEIRIFIDMRKPAPEKEGKAYIFRVITRSHPWGYQYTDNTKPLETRNKSKALELWNQEDPFSDEVLSLAYPWDAIAPLPLNIFTRAALQNISLESLTKSLLSWVKRAAPNTNEATITKWLEVHKASVSGKEARPCETYSIEEVYNNIKALVADYIIPALPLPEDLFSPGKTQQRSASESSAPEIEEAIKQDDGDEIEQVFVRLNSGGTVIGGEELNYSIIKARIDSKLQSKIEKSCLGIMKPARFISIAFRLYQNHIRKDSNSINLRIKPKQFQREMREHKEFFDFMEESIIEAGLLEKVKSFLKYGEDMSGYRDSLSDYRLPYPLFIKIAATSQGEVMFMLMYRLLGSRDQPPDNFRFGTKEHRRMIGIILMFIWNGKDARSRHNKLLEKAWDSVKKLPFKRMWSKEIVAATSGEDELKPIPKSNRFLSPIRGVRKDTKIWSRCNDGEYGHFINHVMCNRDILLWIQRDFLSRSPFFKEDLFRLDDTDVPFDWDHISPENLVKGKQNIPAPLRDIYQQPCNIRAWPYRLNRSDQDDVPSRKFSLVDPERAAFLKKALPGLSSNEINEYLMKNSFCEKSWQKFDEGWLKGAKINGDYWQDVYQLIWARWKDMFDQLANELRLSELN